VLIEAPAGQRRAAGVEHRGRSFRRLSKQANPIDNPVSAGWQ